MTTLCEDNCEDSMRSTAGGIHVGGGNRSGNKKWPTINTLRPRQNGRHFPDDIFRWIFFNENVWISINISLKFVPRGPINNIPTLVQVMAWRRPGDKPLSAPMMVLLPTHICPTRPQWVKALIPTTEAYHLAVIIGATIAVCYLSLFGPGRCGSNLQVYFSNPFYELIAVPVQLVSDEWHWTPLMWSQCWFM